MRQTQQGVGGAGGAVRADRLAAARTALARAEERTGLRGRGAWEVSRAFGGASRDMRGSGAAALAVPMLRQGEEEAGGVNLLPTGAESVGVATVTGSAGALLVLAARRQGEEDWCGVVGCEGLGWRAAAEAGLDLSRVLAVPAAELPPEPLTAVLGALLDGVAVLLVSATVAAGLRPRDRRTLLARARERGRLILTPSPWEGARTLTAQPADVGTELPTDLATAGPQPAFSPSPQARGGSAAVVVPLRSRAPDEPLPQELVGGYLQHLAWTLRSPHRPGQVRLLLDAAGAHLSPTAPEARAVPTPTPRPRLVLVGGADAPNPQEETA
ncbi:hypothetical protein [Actinomyces ruminicola]|uniref:Uncharacterized protein n=1 Tax=Actinomyces ruminicola TaxID=332524 RepID=A0A1G9UAP1_9ACTO|nr:hypothetical protein [Actinomyces ruminicola]SDM57017.1 hypothetical protein SAMN04487766_10426 [Actinomyces ruminicola]